MDNHSICEREKAFSLNTSAINDYMSANHSNWILMLFAKQKLGFHKLYKVVDNYSIHCMRKGKKIAGLKDKHLHYTACFPPVLWLCPKGDRLEDSMLLITKWLNGLINLTNHFPPSVTLDYTKNIQCSAETPRNYMDSTSYCWRK